MALLTTPMQTIMSIPRASRALAGIYLFTTLTYLFFSYSVPKVPGAGPSTLESNLFLYPGTFIWAPWTIVTSSFVERNLFELLQDMIIIPFSLGYLETLWGTRETVKFTLLVCTISNVIAVGVNYLESFVIGNPSLFLYNMQYHGSTALFAGILVGIRQAIPEHQIQILGLFSVRVKSLPMAYVGISNVACILGFQSPWILIQFGWLVSYFYLRFYKRSTSDPTQTLSGSGAALQGDRSETFAFIYWFPPFAHRPVGILSDFVYKYCLRFGIVQGPPSDIEAAEYQPVGAGNARAEAERRRAMALKALDQRLASSSAARAQEAGTSSAARSEPAGTRPPGADERKEGADESGR